MAHKAHPRKKSVHYNPKTFLARLRKGIRTTRWAENSKIYAQGDPSNAVFFVAKGRVRLSVASKQAKEAVIAILNGGSFFGEACLTGQIVRPATARAVTPTTLTRIPKTTMVSALRENPKFSGYFVSYLLSRNLRMEEDIVDHLFNSSEKRLARLLMILAHFGKDGRTEKVVPRISQETLAGMVGTTRERINLFMNKFRRLGFVEYEKHDDGELSIHSSLVNVILHD